MTILVDRIYRYRSLRIWHIFSHINKLSCEIFNSNFHSLDERPSLKLKGESERRS